MGKHCIARHDVRENYEDCTGRLKNGPKDALLPSGQRHSFAKSVEFLSRMEVELATGLSGDQGKERAANISFYAHRLLIFWVC